jgi:multicomponent Na+:H+ antiporter subunit G
MIITLLQIGMISLGVFFLFTGTVGLVRLPDVFTRMHATTKCDTMGLGLVLGGLMLRAGSWPNLVKLCLILLFLWLTSPTVAHLVAQAAWLNGSEMHGIPATDTPKDPGGCECE